MNIKVTDLESKIDKQYYDIEIEAISKDGIELPGCCIHFEECADSFNYSSELGIGERRYVGAKNCLTDPPYMKFNVKGDNLFLLFSTKDSFYDYAQMIKEYGFDMFDLS